MKTKLSPQTKYARKLAKLKKDAPERKYPCALAPCYEVMDWECSTCPLYSKTPAQRAADFIAKYGGKK